MSNKKGRETKIARTTYVIIAAVLVVTGATSLIAWGSKGFENWNVPGWFGYVPAPETPAVPAAPEEVTPAGYKFVMQSEAVAQASARASIETELKETFSASNEITLNSPTGKGAKWLSENTYDTFCYTALFYVPKMAFENFYTFKNTAFYERDFICVGNIKHELSELQAFAGFFYCDYNSENSVEINCNDWSGSIGVFKLEITEKQLRLCPLVYDYNDWHSTRTKTYASGTNEYAVVKKAFLEGNLTLTGAPEEDSYFTSYITESISIKENLPVKDPVPLPPTPEKEGYTFAGWYYDEALTRPYDGKPIYEDTALYAKFTINRHTVTFNSDGGTEIQAQTVDWGTELTPPTPENVGYDFIGWFLDDGTEYTGQAIKEDITLTAKWQIKTFTVTFYVGGEVYATRTVDYGTTFAELAEEAKDLNLKVLTVMTEQGEQSVDEISGMPITGDYSVMGENLNVVERVQHFIKNYPWIFFAVGAGLSVIIGLIGRVCYNKALEQAYARTNRGRSRNSRNGRRY